MCSSDLVFPAFFGSFRSNSAAQFFGIVRAMFVPASSSPDMLQLFDVKILSLALAGIVLGFPVYEIVVKKFSGYKIFRYLEVLLLIVLFAAALSSSSIIFSDPFIYFRF